MSAEPTPRRLSPGELLLNALADIQDVVAEHRALAAHLHKILEPQQEPGTLHPLKINSARAYTDEAADHGSRSFTVLNVSGIDIALGTGGVGASNVAAIVVPAASALTLPITAENLEVGPADPTVFDAGATIGPGVDVYVFVITYRHVHPFFFGAWAG